MVGLFISKVNAVVNAVVEVVFGIVATAVATGVGVGDGDGVSGVVKAGSGFCSSGVGVGVAGSSVVVVAVAVARINVVGFKGFFYEVCVIVLENVVFLQEAAGVGNGHLCLFPFLFIE